jgi:hypothetical protein
MILVRINEELMSFDRPLLSFSGRNLIIAIPRPRLERETSNPIIDSIVEASPTTVSEVYLVVITQKIKPSPDIPILLTIRKIAFFLSGSRK